MCEGFDVLNAKYMLRVQDIRRFPERVREGLRKRGWNGEEIAIVDEILALDDERRKVQAERDQWQNQIKEVSKRIGEHMRQGQRESAEILKEQVAEAKARVRALEDKLRSVQEALEGLLLSVPNIPHDEVPEGKGEEDNVVVYQSHDPLPSYPEGLLPHWEVAERYGLFSFSLGAKLTGSGFPVYLDKGAKLQRALIQYFLDRATAAGYVEVWPPLLVNAASAKATGQLPDKEGQMYHVCKDDFYLIPTAEVPITNLYRDVILDEAQLPILHTGYTPCFRREAGSYGADVKGLNRVHQFDKVEIVQIVHPEQSWKALDAMVRYVRELVHTLGLPFRIVRLCGGDLGFTSAMTYDFEVYAAAQKKWLEISSVSNFLTYQSYRLKLRFRDRDGKLHYAHTLNGSALALARVVAALLENNQSPQGVIIPEVLRPYMGMEILS